MGNNVFSGLDFCQREWGGTRNMSCWGVEKIIDKLEIIRKPPSKYPQCHRIGQSPETLVPLMCRDSWCGVYFSFFISESKAASSSRQAWLLMQWVFEHCHFEFQGLIYPEHNPCDHHLALYEPRSWPWLPSPSFHFEAPTPSKKS